MRKIEKTLLSNDLKIVMLELKKEINKQDII